jgi:hypothetical protein
MAHAPWKEDSRKTCAPHEVNDHLDSPKEAKVNKKGDRRNGGRGIFGKAK